MKLVFSHSDGNVHIPVCYSLCPGDTKLSVSQSCMHVKGGILYSHGRTAHIRFSVMTAVEIGDYVMVEYRNDMTWDTNISDGIRQLVKAEHTVGVWNVGILITWICFAFSFGHSDGSPCISRIRFRSWSCLAISMVWWSAVVMMKRQTKTRRGEGEKGGESAKRVSFYMSHRNIHRSQGNIARAGTEWPWSVTWQHFWK